MNAHTSEQRQLVLRVILGSHLALMAVLIFMGDLMKADDASGAWGMLSIVAVAGALLCSMTALVMGSRLLAVDESRPAEAPSFTTYFNRVILLATIAELGALMGVVAAVYEGNLIAQIAATAFAAAPFVFCFFPLSNRFFAIKKRYLE